MIYVLWLVFLILIVPFAVLSVLHGWYEYVILSLKGEIEVRMISKLDEDKS